LRPLSAGNLTGCCWNGLRFLAALDRLGDPLDPP
jgi:hypothetical protein